MRYGQIRKYDVANGEGIRTSIFVTGCNHNCFNCFNKEYQDFNCGDLWTDEETNKLISYLKLNHIKGLSILGGEPMENEVELLELVKKVKKVIKKDIWLWSGFTFEEIIQSDSRKNLLKEIDVLVDGKFIEKLKNLNLKFRGSENQRIIDVKNSFEKNKIILYKD